MPMEIKALMPPKERAAKAIRKVADYCMTMPFAREMAEAALAAITEPSEAMVEAGARYWMAGSDWLNFDSTACWRAMHAAMMAEKDTGE